MSFTRSSDVRGDLIAVDFSDQVTLPIKTTLLSAVTLYSTSEKTLVLVLVPS